ncbi:MAG TPA: M24 family metallopeptidase [Anaeromyxobacter sp.]|nr:M24 family metallopeptidase [Anaeromyxobacter sp.]
MELLWGRQSTGHEQSFRQIEDKLRGGTIGAEDLPEEFAFFAQVCNTTDEIRYEIGEAAYAYQFNIDGNIFTISFGERGCESWKGASPKPTVIFTMSTETVLRVLNGKIYSLVAQMGGFITYTGPKPEALVFQNVFELFLDRFRTDRPPTQAPRDPEDKRLRFGIIGAGQAFQFHSNGDRGSKYLTFTAVYDTDYKKARKMAQRYSEGTLVPYKTLDEMLGADIDAVLVLVPHVYHDDLVVAAAKAGKHVLCEKPMSTTVEGCRRMIAACQDAGVKFMVAENHRFLPAHVCVHDIVQKGLIGEVRMIRAYEGVNEVAGLSTSGFWKGDPIKAGGGALMDMAAHKFASIEYIIGSKVKRITANLSKQAINLPEKAEDNAIAIAEYENGAVADIMVSFTQMTVPYNSLEIFGTRGSVFENHAWERPVRFCSFDERMGEDQQKWVEPEVEHAPFPEYYTISAREEDEHFARSILENREPEFSPVQAMNAITAILAGYLSAIEGRPVEVDEVNALADRGLCRKNILERLAPAIPINQNLPEVGNVQPIGFSAKKAAEVMNRYDLDLLIAASPVNVYYLSGMPLLHCSANPILLALNNQYPNLAMIRREGEGTVIHWNVFKSTDRFSWFHDLVGIESQADVGRALRSKIRKWGLSGKKVGIESTAPKFLLDALADDGGMTVVAADRAFLDMRLVKTPLEIGYLQKAADITEAALKDTIAAVKEGVTDLELLRIGRDSLLRHGADDWDHLTMTIGDSDPEAPGTGRAVKRGEIVRLDFGGVYKGYVADINQEVVIGDADPEADKLIQGLLEFQHYFEVRIKPGVNMKALSDEATAWYKKTVPNGIAFSIGHSIGLQCEDQHLFGALGQLDRPFEENMVFEIEAWEPYKGALIGVEDCYMVTKDGCRKMTSMPKSIIRV